MNNDQLAIGNDQLWLFRLERDYCHVLPLDCQIQRAMAMDLPIHRERIPLAPEGPQLSMIDEKAESAFANGNK